MSAENFQLKQTDIYSVCAVDTPCTNVAVLTQRMDTMERCLIELKSRYPKEITLIVSILSLIIGVLGASLF